MEIIIETSNLKTYLCIFARCFMSYVSIGCYVFCNFRLNCVSLHDALCRMSPLGVMYCVILD